MRCPRRSPRYEAIDIADLFHDQAEKQYRRAAKDGRHASKNHPGAGKGTPFQPPDNRRRGRDDQRKTKLSRAIEWLAAHRPAQDGRIDRPGDQPVSTAGEQQNRSRRDEYAEQGHGYLSLRVFLCRLTTELTEGSHILRDLFYPC